MLEGNVNIGNKKLASLERKKRTFLTDNSDNNNFNDPYSWENFN